MPSWATNGFRLPCKFRYVDRQVNFGEARQAQVRTARALPKPLPETNQRHGSKSEAVAAKL